MGEGMDTTTLNNLLAEARNDLDTINRRTQKNFSWQDFILKSIVLRQVKFFESLVEEQSKVASSPVPGSAYDLGQIAKLGKK